MPLRPGFLVQTVVAPPPRERNKGPFSRAAVWERAQTLDSRVLGSHPVSVAQRLCKHWTGHFTCKN